MDRNKVVMLIKNWIRQDIESFLKGRLKKTRIKTENNNLNVMDFRMNVSVKKIIMGVMAYFGLGQAALAESIPDFKNMLRAAEQGDPEAQLSIGAMYANGQGISQDNRLAVQWFHKAQSKRMLKLNLTWV